MEATCYVCTMVWLKLRLDELLAPAAIYHNSRTTGARGCTSFRHPRGIGQIPRSVRREG